MEYIEQTDIRELVKNVVEIIGNVPGVSICSVFDGEDINDFEYLNSYLNDVDGAAVYVDLPEIETYNSNQNEGIDAVCYFNLYVAARKDYTDDQRFENNSMICLNTCQNISAALYENNLEAPVYSYPNVTGWQKFLSESLNNGTVTAYAIQFNVTISLFKKNKYY